MYYEDIFLELMRHMSFDLKSFSLTCKLAQQTYQNNKSGLLQYGNYRFSAFQHSLVNTLATKNKEPMLLHTYNNRGKKAAIIIFALFYNRKVNIVTNKNEYEKWYKEYNEVAEDKSLIIFDKLNHKNYNILISTEVKKPNNLFIFYKSDHPYVACDNYVYINKYNINNRINHIYYPYLETCFYKNMVCEQNEKKLNDMFNVIHFNYQGPYIVIGNKAHQQAYMIMYINECKKKIRPNTIYFIHYDKFITNTILYDKFKTFVLLWPTTSNNGIISQTYEKLKSYNNKNIIAIHDSIEGEYIEKAIININTDYHKYNVKLTSFAINTNKYLQLINRLLVTHGDKLKMVPNDYFVLLMYVCKDDLKIVLRMIDTLIDKIN